MNIFIPKDVSFIIDTFYKNGYEAFMVGGCVRDSILNKPPTDYDITTSALPEVTESLFKNTIPTGLKHGTVTVVINKSSYEITTYRTESTYINNRKPEKVTFVSDIKEDLSRRDFTINALAYNNKVGLIDYYNGIDDLKNKIIRAVGVANTRFNEDALRMLRAIRFSSQLNFTIEENTYLAIKNNSSLLQNISKERINSELCKILLSNNCEKGIEDLLNTNLLHYIIPSLEGSESLSKSIRLLSKTNKSLYCRLAFLLKSLEYTEIDKILKDLRFDNTTKNATLLLVENLDNISTCSSKADFKILINKVGKNLINDLLSLYEVYYNKDLNNEKTIINNIFINGEAIFIKDLNINGNILKDKLNLPYGKLIGDILNYLLLEVINETIPNDTNVLINKAKEYMKRR